MTIIRRPSPPRETVAPPGTLGRVFDESTSSRPSLAALDEVGMLLDIRTGPATDDVAHHAPGEHAGHEKAGD